MSSFLKNHRNRTLAFLTLVLSFGILPCVHAMITVTLPLLDTNGKALAFNKFNELIVNQQSTKQITLQYSHEGGPGNNFNCVQLLCGKDLVTDEQCKRIISYIIFNASQTPTNSLFKNQLTIFTQVSDQNVIEKFNRHMCTIQEALPNGMLTQNNCIFPLMNPNTELTMDGNAECGIPIWINLFRNPSQKNYVKAVLMYGNQPATEGQQYRITLFAHIERAKYLEKTTKEDASLFFTFPFNIFYTQLLAMNSPHNKEAYCAITAQPFDPNIVTAFEENINPTFTMHRIPVYIKQYDCALPQEPSMGSFQSCVNLSCLTLGTDETSTQEYLDQLPKLKAFQRDFEVFLRKDKSSSNYFDNLKTLTLQRISPEYRENVTVVEDKQTLETLSIERKEEIKQRLHNGIPQFFLVHHDGDILPLKAVKGKIKKENNEVIVEQKEFKIQHNRIVFQKNPDEALVISTVGPWTLVDLKHHPAIQKICNFLLE